MTSTRKKAIVVGLALVSAWVGTAFYRMRQVQSRALAVVMSYPPEARDALTGPGGWQDLDVRVPLVPLLINPFKVKPRAYVFRNEIVEAEVNY